MNLCITFDVNLNVTSPQLAQLVQIGTQIMDALKEIQDKVDTLTAANAELKTANETLVADSAEMKGKLENLIVVAMSTKDALVAAVAGQADPAALQVMATKLDAGIADAQAALQSAATAKQTLDAGDAEADDAAQQVAP